MKYTLTLLFAFSAFLFESQAQTFVSTAPGNKTVLLEEYTGIYCQFCPDGHKVANSISAANPGKIHIINVHTGGYANPQSGDPNFTTPFGAALASAASVSGYPAGSINRSGSAMSRGLWSNSATQKLGESAYVNVAAQSELDLGTRQLTVNVEAYYTGTSPNASNMLNVALLQNNVEGPQSGGSSYNPSSILPNGNYNHMHMLRHLLTGQWGDSITNTSTGSFISKTYTYTVPSNLNGVDYVLGDLEVVVFVAEGQDEVISAAKSDMSYITLPGQEIIDLELTEDMTSPAYCDYTITPQIKITNPTSIDADSVYATYTHNGSTPVSKLVSVSKNATETVTFPAISPDNGRNEIQYNINLDGIYATLDINKGNNSAAIMFHTVSQTPVGTTHSEGFETYSLGDDDFNNAFIENPNGERLYIADQAISNSVTWPLGGHGNSEECLRYDLIMWGLNSQGALVFDHIDMSSASNSSLRFSYAYSGVNLSGTDYNDCEFKVLASTDCGQSYTAIFEKRGSDLATTDIVVDARLYPEADDWVTVTLNTAAFEGQSEVLYKFEAHSHNGGNSLYLDDIELIKDFSSVQELDRTMAIYPQPASSYLILDLDRSFDQAVFFITDMLGKQLTQPMVAQAGENKVNTELLETGLYLIQINKEGKKSSIKFIVE